MTARRGGAALAAAVLLVGLGACGSTDQPAPDQPAAPPAVALNASLPEAVTIGVVVSLASAPGEGAEWRDAAEGAQVAAHRFELGGADVTLVPVNDRGTASGAADAVRTLAGKGVAGIVLATSGSHLNGALTEAAKDGIPLLLPYEQSIEDLPSAAWITGPDQASVDARLVSALADADATRPFLVDAGGGAVAGLSPVDRLAFAAGDDPAALATTLAKRLTKPAQRFDAVVVSGPAQLQAQVVQGLQGAGVAVPYVLTPDVLSPAFPTALSQAQGSLSGSFISAGVDDGDAVALGASTAGRAMAAYFAGLQLTAGDPSEKDFSGERPFSAVAGVADVASHDAVVALVRAAAAARSTDPAKVGEALATLRLGTGDGLAGTALDFSAPAAVDPAAVVPLAATSQSPGVRPAATTSTPALFWFPVPAS